MSNETQTEILDAQIEAEAMTPNEDYIWIDGYKGLDENMQGHDHFQYEVGKSYHHDGEVKLCESGFHFCLNLDDVFRYYALNKKNRFFKVKGLVTKEAYERALRKQEVNYVLFTPYGDSKIVTSDIEIIEEIDIFQLLKTLHPDWEDRYIEEYISNGKIAADKMKEVWEVTDKYPISVDFVTYLRNIDRLDFLKALLTQYSVEDALHHAIYAPNATANGHDSSYYSELIQRLATTQTLYPPAPTFKP